MMDLPTLHARGTLADILARQGDARARLSRRDPGYGVALGRIMRRVQDDLTEAISDHLVGGDPQGARDLACAWYGHVGDGEACARLQSGWGIDRVARALARAWSYSGYRPQPEDLLLRYPALSDADLARAARQRAVGAWAEWGLLQGDDTHPPRAGGVHALWRRVRWLLEDPDLAPAPPGVARLALHPDLLSKVMDVLCGLPLHWGLEGGCLALQVDGAYRGLPVRIRLVVPGDAQARSSAVATPRVLDPLPAATSPVVERVDLDPLLAVSCRHGRARWQENACADALRLACPDCGQISLACVPLHQVPGRVRDVKRYLALSRFYAALADEPLPWAMADLAGGIASLDPRDHLPRAADRSPTLSEALFA